MSKQRKKIVTKIKKGIQFERSVPRCQTCIHYPHHSAPLCDINNIYVKAFSLCNLWEDKKGYSLENNLNPPIAFPVL